LKILFSRTTSGASLFFKVVSAKGYPPLDLISVLISVFFLEQISELKATELDVLKINFDFSGIFFKAALEAKQNPFRLNTNIIV